MYDERRGRNKLDILSGLCRVLGVFDVVDIVVFGGIGVRLKKG
jgi:hypothetical protein